MADYNSTYTGAQIDANLAKAATAVQPAGLATVATTGAYSDLTGKPTLGTAAAAATGDFATAAQGALADSAVQPADDAADLGSGAATDGYVLTADGAGGAAWEAAAGGGGTPGGTDTQVQFNDGGAFGGDSGFTFDKTNNTLGLGGGTITASDPIIDMAQTWNNAAVTFTAVKANVTDTASAAGSMLMDLQVGGVSKFVVDKAGDITLAGTKISNLSTTITTAIFYGTSAVRAGTLYLGANFANILTISSGRAVLQIGDSNIFEQRNGVNAQAFNLYNTYTDASNYERGFMRFVSNTLRIGTEKLGTGTARALELHTDGTTRMTIAAAGGVFVQGGFRVTDGSLVNLSSGVTGIWSNFGTANYIGNESGHVFSLRTSNIDRLTVDTVGSVRVSTALTVVTLPATPLVGMMARVTDATSPAVGSAVTGGGAAAALCWYNGTNWTVIGA